jgi:hypothetical protein
MIEEPGGALVSQSPPQPTDQTAAHEALARLLTRAEQGGRSVLPELRAALDANAEVWQRYGDLAGQAQAALVTLAAGPNVLLAESLLRKLQALKDELGGESPSPLERLLVERVTATWLQVSYFDGLLAQARGVSECQAKMLQRQQDAAHRRHLSAVKTLATVRKLLTPTPAPIEIAARLEGRRLAGGRGGFTVVGGVPVTN